VAPLALHKGDPILGRVHVNQHMHMIRQQMTLLNATLLLPNQLVKHLAQFAA